MFWDFIVPVIIILCICYCLLPKFRYGVDTNIIQTRHLLNELSDADKQNAVNTPDLSKKERTDTCMASSPEKCPVGKYTQCTNNVLPDDKCNCTDQRSYEVCSKDTMDNLLCMNDVLPNDKKEYGKYATRVNQWTVGQTEYNDPGNLHIKRTNPYVEEL